jgi:nitrogen fixation NifU-like protein
MSTDRIIEHLESPRCRRDAPQVTHAHAVSNPLCGDTVRIELEIADGVVRLAYFDGVGCGVSQAAASMLVEHVEGRSADEIKRFSAADMLALFGPRLTPLRQRCCLLAWQALHVAMYSPIGSG